MRIVTGTEDNDRLFPIRDEDTEIRGLGGNDVLFAGGGADTLDGGEGFDNGRFSTFLDGEPVFFNGVTVDLMQGIATGETSAGILEYILISIEDLFGSNGNDRLTGDAGGNIIQGLFGDDEIFGLAGDDQLFAGGGTDTLNGGEGDDTLFASSGDTTLNGGDGEDRIAFTTTFNDNPIFVNGITGSLATGIVTAQLGNVLYTYTLQEVENLIGSEFADVITGDDGDNLLRGFGGDDILKGGAGDDILGGNAGNDIALYDGASSHFTIQFRIEDNDAFIVDRTGAEGTDQGGANILRFSDRDFLQVADGDIYFDQAEFTPEQFEALVELYIAYFNRAPDAEGLNFWTLAVINGTSFDQAAEFFFDQPETRALYGDTLDLSSFVTSVYENVLGRGPDDGGRTFWVDALNSGDVTEGQFIRNFLEGARAAPPADADPAFIAQQNADRAFLDTKIDIGANFGAILGMSNVDNANTVMSLFDGSAASLTAARNATDDMYQAALATDGTGELLIQVVGFLDDPFA